MIAARIHDAELMPARGKIEIGLPDLGPLRIRKIDGDDSADGGSHLVHKPARLAEIDVFRVLRRFGHLHGGHRAAVEQVAENGAEQDLERRRR